MIPTQPLPPSISPEALMGKSKAFIRKALAAKASGDPADYQLWASLALELLAKASLATIHPSLIVDVQKNPNAVLAAAGIEVSARVATIGADAAYTRLKHTAAPRFNHGVYEACKGMAELRNAHLHSGELPFDGRIAADVWESGFWHACEVVLESVDLNLDDWLGATDAQATRALIAAAAEAKTAAAKKKISESGAEFTKRVTKAKERERVIEESKHLRISLYTASFKRPLDHHWLEKCPACTAQAVVGGDQTYESLADDQDYEEGGWELVDLGYAAEELQCPTCGLQLRGEEALIAAGVDLEHVEQEEREIEYEPDYGND
ncbi:hypothetical protein [Burkholderia stagnalis]|uniref:hypothetical protein n=1 Tax=Burkholderia stagnalis TaxID=1503054 RepID=UPI000AE5C070|nr:hypothetical protein [Burkholderia stagnalis]